MKSFAALLAAAGVASAQSLADVLTQTNATSQLAQLVQGVPGLLDRLSSAQGITILAPNNEAIARFTAENGAAVQADPDLVPAVLNYHVLNGTIRAADITGAPGPLFPRTLLDDDDYEDVAGTQYLEAQAVNNGVTFFSGLERNSTVVQADVNFTGGVIHIIDQVLTLPANITVTATAAGLSSLAGALIQTELLETVNEADNITVFAPSNAAFQNIASVLSNATRETITSVLTYHVVNSSVIFSTDLRDGAQVPTLNGGSLTINQEGDNFFVNGALISTPNVLVENGVVHVIDQVLNPGNATAAPAAGATAGAVQFQGAQAGSEPPLTSGVPAPTSTISSGAGATSRAGGSASASPPASTGGAAKIAAPIAGAIVGVAAFLI
ncbi:fasciclin domain-containing protein 4 [Elsinoe australis]|uniref:Fasciclin domain-containing protein 4 n=1 Tax=Elsinoe australis TaxID=40998 RepID=A0A4U7B1E1_9PEZI|nr:fasciclin domain-containing protein 4 [Elsinoe australis]